ncbi:hypothetical protein [Streptococcus halotolerans]|uniref:hypothetical protein n=1 Tax=Streptococcus halotolerans TaxID=1814128 RepID=UPI000786B1CE|nr:hypothetical protein [Streptococcus halotolerans]
MKRYLSIVGLLTIVLSFSYYFYYFDGSLYLPNGLFEKSIKTNFQVKGKHICQTQSGQPFQVKGVDLESSLAGYHQNEFPIDEATYRKWFRKITAMGANTIRVKMPMNVAFYDALYHHNREEDIPLYLLQGFRIDSYRNNAAMTAFDNPYRGYLLREAKGVVDIIHGRKQVWNTDFGSSHYHHDLSKWLLGYIVGDDWNSGTVAYTNHQQKPQRFKGNYFSTSSDANSFETVLAEVMEEVIHYESKKYGWQHLISFSNSPMTDPFLYHKRFAAQAPKYVSLNIEHIKPSAQVKAGIFASYKAFDFHPDYKDYLLFHRTGVDNDIVRQVKALSLAQGYVRLLTAFHKKPVLVTGFGYSTSRGVDKDRIDQTELPMTEEVQGKRIVADYKSFIDSGTVGATINAWQDDWNARSWNTSFATDKHSNFLWGDVQVYNQGYGLMGFENALKTHRIDGKKGKKEWQKPLGNQKKGHRLFVDSDQTYLYLGLEGSFSDSNQELVIPIDVTPNSGSQKATGISASFEKKSDFLLLLNPKGQSRLLVQETYNATKANYLKQMNGKDFYTYPPEKDSKQFDLVTMVLRNTTILEDIEKAGAAERYLPTFPTGLLRKGTDHHGVKMLDSQTDIVFGEKWTEMRIPWQLLNFSNPATKRIHDNYFQHYGVKQMESKTIALGCGLAQSQETISMADYPLANWERPKVKAFLKASYSIIKREWNKKGE